MAEAISGEAQSIFDLCERDGLKAFQLVRSQLATLVLRTQAILLAPRSESAKSCGSAG